LDLILFIQPARRGNIISRRFSQARKQNVLLRTYKATHAKQIVSLLKLDSVTSQNGADDFQEQIRENSPESTTTRFIPVPSPSSDNPRQSDDGILVKRQTRLSVNGGFQEASADL
jgi:hypothetical protein